MLHETSDREEPGNLGLPQEGIQVYGRVKNPMPGDVSFFTGV